MSSLLVLSLYTKTCVISQQGTVCMCTSGADPGGGGGGVDWVSSHPLWF